MSGMAIIRWGLHDINGKYKGLVYKGDYHEKEEI